MTRLSAETQHEERCHCEFVTDSVNLQSEGEKKREGEIFPGLWDTVILIKSRRAEKESWEIKSVQHRRTHVAKHGKNNRGEGDKRMKPTPRSQYTDMDFFLSLEVLLRPRRSVAVLSVLPNSDYHLQLSAGRLTLSKLQKTLQDWNKIKIICVPLPRNGRMVKTKF